MALTRRSGSRFTANIWPGFVDAMTALLLVLMFVLSIFMIVQSILRTTVSTQETELIDLAGQVASLAEALGLEQQSSDRLETQVGLLDSQLDDASSEMAQQTALIASLTNERDSAFDELSEQALRISSFEAQVASLLAQNSELSGTLATAQSDLVERTDALGAAQASIEALEAATAREITEKEALQLALAQARDEIDVAAEEARLAAARREALDALVADLRSNVQERDAELTSAATKIAESSEQAKLAAAQRAALEAMVANLQSDIETKTGEADTASSELREMMALLAATQKDASEVQALRAQLADITESLSDAERAQLIQIAASEELRSRLKNAEAKLSADEAQRLADAAAAEALRERLANADTELTAMTLNLEAQRKKAEETLTLLAAERAARKELEAVSGDALTDRDRQGLLLAEANSLLADEKARSADSARQVELLNQQTAELRQQLSSLQGLLDAANTKDAQAKVQIEALGRNLNTALAQVAAEQKNRADEQARIAELEAAEVARLAAEAQDLRRYRSEFFGRVREILGDREGVQVQGDRFVFSSEVLFPAGSANLGAAGRQQIAKIAAVLKEVAGEIPDEINWILRVDGHTDNKPLSGLGEFSNNWELSQARALSVVEYLVDGQGIPPNRLAATGFGEFQPVDTGNSPDALALNRRIELKFTEK